MKQRDLIPDFRVKEQVDSIGKDNGVPDNIVEKKGMRLREAQMGKREGGSSPR